MPLNKLLACRFIKYTFQDRQYLSEVYCSICTTVTETHSDSESELKLQKIIEDEEKTQTKTNKQKQKQAKWQPEPHNNSKNKWRLHYSDTELVPTHPFRVIIYKQLHEQQTLAVHITSSSCVGFLCVCCCCFKMFFIY